jgi:hypothetical protein
MARILVAVISGLVHLHLYELPICHDRGKWAASAQSFTWPARLNTTAAGKSRH